MCFTSGPSYADPVVNIQFGMGDDPYDGGGIAYHATTSQTWNLVDYMDGTDVPLQYADGSDGPVKFSIYMNGEVVSLGKNTGGSAFTPDNPDQNLMLGYLRSDDTYTADMSITGLPPGTYNIYIYSQCAAGVPGALMATASTSGNTYHISIANAGEDSSFIEGVNWLKTTLVISDGTLSMSVDKDTVGTINGMQIEAVPEPGNIILLGVGGIFTAGLLSVRARKTVDINA